ncbi:hypothetical protein MTX26_27075 [Bradyrhizobium sp. ISRA443]|uniref:hypothetical protein n=1 Tax=unclassified Bradyrhizobium TaxID=2631580 RepID=UPI0024788146|nr:MULTISPECIES: hypothetical protein [unclassified Bradyrhizobium]WGR97962.1 hypothetical protein MTX23_27070 [Bradyrhizobium sp. ISRA436]WGS04852.1 hypothetical protein MTX18_27080 [Bradyrhizobium sp. ISRA437]WGS11733.1 hypothetical protein MTX26_27075 [Bradyrhizobium sp. ISRA443]
MAFSKVPYNGAPLGILMLERGGRLDRPFIPGDTGNASTWSVPVRYKPVPGLTAKRILGRDPGAPDMTPAVVQAAVELVQEGAELITCGCGYSIRYQEAVRAAVDVPVFLSSLLLAPFLEKMLPPHKALGIIVASKLSLPADFLETAGFRSDIGRRVVVVGLEDAPVFTKTFIMGGAARVDAAGIEADLVNAALALQRDRPDVGALLLECGDLPPYAAAIQRATGIPVFDYTSLIEFFIRGLVRKPFVGIM